MATTYRKKKGDKYDGWHFCTNCLRWPITDFEEKTVRPFDSELCNECKVKEKDKNCR